MTIGSAKKFSISFFPSIFFFLECMGCDAQVVTHDNREKEKKKKKKKEKEGRRSCMHGHSVNTITSQIKKFVPN